MSIPLALILVAAGIALILTFAGRLVAGAEGTARGFGLSAFLVSVVFFGFDPENLGVGVVGAYEGVPGIALGSIIGAAMVAMALALGVTVLIAPLRFERAPVEILVLPVLSVLLFGGLILDGRLSRIDGAILLAAYAAAVIYMVYLGRRGTSVVSEEAEGAEEEGAGTGRWRAFGLLLLSLAVITAGSEMVVQGSERVLAWLGVTDTFYGMAVLALLISIEELARELPAALRGKADISFGTVVGSVFAFFLMNAGIIGLVKPVPVDSEVLYFHLPAAVVTVVFVAAVARTGRIPRWAGAGLTLLYLGFLAGSYVLGVR